MSRLRFATAVMLAAGLAACASTPRPTPGRPADPAPSPAAAAAPSPRVTRPETPGVPLASLPGWTADDHVAGLGAFQQACHLAQPAELCREARAFVRPSAETARAFFEARFVAQAVDGGPALLTGYFAPEYTASWRRTAEFDMPVRPRPADLRVGQPYPERAAIEARPSTDALAWMRAEDLFFLQIQGSGTLAFPGGERRSVAFAAHNDQPFTGIARPMVQRGLLEDGRTSGNAIRRWLAEHRGREAQALMRLNRRYVFFRLGPDDGNDPQGAAGLPLPAGRGVAVDPAAHAYGTLLWIDAEAPRLAGAFPTYRRLVTALDTGGAIRGPVRADLYTGRGDAAGTEAGRIRHQLRLWRLVPRRP